MLIAQFFVNSVDFSGDLGQMKVSYRLGLNPTEVEERVDSAQQLANQVIIYRFPFTREPPKLLILKMDLPGKL
jgi:hypothetical protein